MRKRQKSKSIQESVRCDCDLAFKRRVEEHAKRQDRSVSYYIRKALKIVMDMEDQELDSKK